MCVMNNKTIAVVGYGTIGESFAQLFAEQGYKVKVSDVRDDLQTLIDTTNERLGADAIKIERADSVEDAVEGAFLVQENGPEKLDFKQDMARKILDANPEAILASSSSALLPSDIARDLPDELAANVLIAHPFNPPRILPLIELVPGDRTSDETMSTAREFYDAIGKVPVTLNREIEGYIANRFQKRILDEAVYLLSEGIASAEDIDKAMKNSLGIRWSVVGPLEAVNQTTPQGFAATVKFIKPSFDMIKDVPSPDYDGEETQRAAEKVAEAYGQTASQESKDQRDLYLQRVAEALEGRK